MSSVTEVSKILKLDLTDIPREKRKEAKNDVRDFLLNEVLRTVGNGKSPVEGEKFKKLQKAYAKEEHGGRTLPILELEGDMLNALKTKDLEGDNVWLGIEGTQAPKADGHNQISAEAKAWASETDRTQYKRRFIPDDKQKFNSKINGGIKNILDGYRITEEEIEEGVEIVTLGKQDSVREAPERVTTTINDIFADEYIEELLLEELRKMDRL